MTFSICIQGALLGTRQLEHLNGAYGLSYFRCYLLLCLGGIKQLLLCLRSVEWE